MKQQFNLLIFIFLALTFFGCDTLRPAENVGDQQDLLSNRVNFGNNWQFRRLQYSLPSAVDWKGISLPHYVKIEPLVVNDQWQGKSLYRKSFFLDKTPAEKCFFEFGA